MKLKYLHFSVIKLPIMEAVLIFSFGRAGLRCFIAYYRSSLTPNKGDSNSYYIFLLSFTLNVLFATFSNDLLVTKKYHT